MIKPCVLSLLALLSAAPASPAWIDVSGSGLGTGEEYVFGAAQPRRPYAFEFRLIDDDQAPFVSRPFARCKVRTTPDFFARYDDTQSSRGSIFTVRADDADGPANFGFSSIGGSGFGVIASGTGSIRSRVLADYTGGSTFGFSASCAPEPASWLMMIAGFGLVGVAIRRRFPIVRFGSAALSTDSDGSTAISAVAFHPSR